MENKTAPTGVKTSIVPQGDRYDIVVFSHLRWDFVYQRPQHILSRMAKDYKILFVEEFIPFDIDENETAEISGPLPNLTVLKPKTNTISSLAAIIKKHCGVNNFSIGWFYSGAFAAVLQHLDFAKVIYDCMDELSLFKGANPLLVEQEKLLLSRADIVFTGGKSLYEAKRKHHRNVHCFPSSVDESHFVKSRNGIAIPNDIKFPRPIVGYYGVIDERIDMDLLEQTAELLPQVSFVMVGPLAKIGPEDLPVCKNIHFLGMRGYNVLPAYLKAFDIAMMPFAINDATTFISPTKTLEYIAGGKPVISTPVYDVVRDYSDVVSIISTAREFSDEINRLLNLSSLSRKEMEKKYDKILSETSWDKTVNKMKSIVKYEIYEKI